MKNKVIMKMSHRKAARANQINGMIQFQIKTHHIQNKRSLNLNTINRNQQWTKAPIKKRKYHDCEFSEYFQNSNQLILNI